MFLFLFLLFSVLLLCSFFRLKESCQVKNGLTMSLLLYFLENPKNLGRSDDAKRKKKRIALLHLISIPVPKPQLRNHGIIQGHVTKAEDVFRGRVKNMEFFMGWSFNFHRILYGVELYFFRSKPIFYGSPLW